MNEGQNDEQLYMQYARIGKCLSSERRLEILNMLSNGPKSVEAIVNRSGMSVANASRHLRILLDANLVKYRKEQKYVIYSLENPRVSEFLTSLWKVSEQQLADIPKMKQNIYNQYDHVKTITKEEILTWNRPAPLVLLDIRPEDEYEAGHIYGAESVPMETLEDFLEVASPDSEYAVYCRGPFCVYTTQAVDQIIQKGFKAYRIEEDVNRWYAN